MLAGHTLATISAWHRRCRLDKMSSTDSYGLGLNDCNMITEVRNRKVPLTSSLTCTRIHIHSMHTAHTYAYTHHTHAHTHSTCTACTCTALAPHMPHMTHMAHAHVHVPHMPHMHACT